MAFDDFVRGLISGAKESATGGNGSAPRAVQNTQLRSEKPPGQQAPKFLPGMAPVGVLTGARGQSPTVKLPQPPPAATSYAPAQPPLTVDQVVNPMPPPPATVWDEPGGPAPAPYATGDGGDGGGLSLGDVAGAIGGAVGDVAGAAAPLPGMAVDLGRNITQPIGNAAVSIGHLLPQGPPTIESDWLMKGLQAPLHPRQYSLLNPEWRDAVFDEIGQFAHNPWRESKQAGKWTFTSNEGAMGELARAQHYLSGNIADTALYELTGEGPKGFSGGPGDVGGKLAQGWFALNWMLNDKHANPVEMIGEAKQIQATKGSTAAWNFINEQGGKGRPGIIGFAKDMIFNMYTDPFTYMIFAGPLEQMLGRSGEAMAQTGRVRVWLEGMDETARAAVLKGKTIEELSPSQLAGLAERARLSGVSDQMSERIGAGLKGVGELIGGIKELSELPEQAVFKPLGLAAKGAKQLPGVGAAAEYLGGASSRVQHMLPFVSQRQALDEVTQAAPGMRSDQLFAEGGEQAAAEFQAAQEARLAQQRADLATGTARTEAEAGAAGPSDIRSYEAAGGNVTQVMEDGSRSRLFSNLTEAEARAVADTRNTELNAARLSTAEGRPTRLFPERRPTEAVPTEPGGVGLKQTFEPAPPTGEVALTAEQKVTAVVDDAVAHRAENPDWEEKVSSYTIKRGNEIWARLRGGGQEFVTAADDAVTAARAQEILQADLTSRNFSKPRVRPVAAPAGGEPVAEAPIATTEAPTADIFTAGPAPAPSEVAAEALTAGVTAPSLPGQGNLPPVTEAVEPPLSARQILENRRRGVVRPTTGPGLRLNEGEVFGGTGTATSANPLGDTLRGGEPLPPARPGLPQADIVQSAAQAEDSIRYRITDSYSREELDNISEIRAQGDQLIEIDRDGNKNYLGRVTDADAAHEAANRLNAWVVTEQAPVTQPLVTPQAPNVNRVGEPLAAPTLEAPGGPQGATRTQFAETLGRLTGEPGAATTALRAELPTEAQAQAEAQIAAAPKLGQDLRHLNPNPEGNRLIDKVTFSHSQQFPDQAQEFLDRYGQMGEAHLGKLDAVDAGKSAGDLSSHGASVEKTILHAEHMGNDMGPLHREIFRSEPDLMTATGRRIPLTKKSLPQLLDQALFDANSTKRSSAMRQIENWSTRDADLMSRMERVRALYDAQNDARLTNFRVKGRVRPSTGDGARTFLDDTLEADATNDALHAAVQNKHLSQQGYDVLMTPVDVKYTTAEGKVIETEERLIDAYARNLEEMGTSDARAATMKQIEDANPYTPSGIWKTKFGRAINAYDGLLRVYKDKQLYGYTSGLRGTLWDLVGDNVTRLLSGEFESMQMAANRDLYGRAKQDIASGTTDALADSDAGRYLQRHGVGLPEEVVSSRVMGEERRAPTLQHFVDRTLEGRRGKRVAKIVAGYFGDENIANLREAGDRTRRFADFTTNFMKAIRTGKTEFFTDAAQLAHSEGISDAQFSDFISGLGDEFAASDVKNLASQSGFSEGRSNRLADNWQGKVNDAKASGIEAVNKVAFDYNATRGDEIARRFFMYHFWASRAAPLYLRTALRNPALYNTYQRVIDDQAKKCEASGGQQCGYLRLWKTAGMAGFMNPAFLVSTWFMNMDPDHADAPNATWLQKALSKTPLAVSPIIQGALSVLGATHNTVNLTQLTQDSNAFTGALNYGRANGWFGSKTLVGNPETAFWNAAEDFSSQVLHKVPFFPGDPTTAPGATANDNTQVQNRITELVAEQYGEDPVKSAIKSWSPEAIAAERAAQEAWTGGKTDNPIANQAFKDYAKGNILGRATSYALPGGTPVKSTALLERRGVRDQAGLPGYEHQTRFGAPINAQVAESQGARSQLQASAVGSPEAAQLYLGDALLDSLGVDPDTGQENDFGYAKRMRDQIVYGDQPPDVLVAGRNIPGSFLTSMEQPDRENVAAAWLAEHQLGDEYQILRDTQDVIRADPSNTLLQKYSDWTGDVRDIGPSEYRRQMVAGNPNFRAYIDSLSPQTLADPGKLDTATTSMKAFMAEQGIKQTAYDVVRDTRDPEAVPFGAAEILGGSGDGNGFGSDNRPIEQQIVADQQKYVADLALANAAAAQFTGTTHNDISQMNPQLRDAIEFRLAQVGITVPQPPASVVGYQTWVAAQQPGADTSLPAYGDWYRRFKASLGNAGAGMEIGDMLSTAAANPTLDLAGMAGNLGSAASPLSASQSVSPWLEQQGAWAMGVPQR